MKRKKCCNLVPSRKLVLSFHFLVGWQNRLILFMQIIFDYANNKQKPIFVGIKSFYTAQMICTSTPTTATVPPLCYCPT